MHGPVHWSLMVCYCIAHPPKIAAHLPVKLVLEVGHLVRRSAILSHFNIQTSIACKKIGTIQEPKHDYFV